MEWPAHLTGWASVSERVTWEQCPRCGGSAAVGWIARSASGEPAQDLPVEFDCPSGCDLDPEELRVSFGD
jgi:hypothetical protein